MQIDVPTMITAGTILATVVASFVRNETNQRQIIKRLDRLNGKVDKHETWIVHHLESCHTEKK